MDLLSTCVIIILIEFGMQSVFIVDFISIFFANIFMCQFVKHVRHNETSLSVLDGLHLWSYTSRQKHQFLVHSKFLCVTVSNSGKMRHGHSLMGRQRHIPYPTQNYLLRSVYGFGESKDHHCLPETLLPKMLISESSVSLIWIYIYSQLQYNM